MEENQRQILEAIVAKDDATNDNNKRQKEE
jgi:hypothetical protein